MHFRLWCLAAALLSSVACTASATGEIQNLSITADRLQEIFNQDSDRARLILVFSPT